MLLSVISVWGITYLSRYVDQMKNFQYFVVDSNKPLALLGGIFLFLTFVFHVKLRYSKFINTIAMATFGVLLIHMHSDSMANFLWKDVFCNIQYSSSPYLIIHFIGTIVILYTVCVIIDLLRIFLLEQPLFKRFGE